MTRASTPGSLSTRTATVCCSIVAVTNFGARFNCRGRALPGPGGAEPRPYEYIGNTAATSHQHHALFRDGTTARLVGGAEQHLVMRGPRRDHREAVLELVDADIGDHRLVGGKHRGDDV